MKAVTPEIVVIAKTAADDSEIERFMRTDECVPNNDPASVIEFAGRACYQSFHKPSAKTRSNKDYIRNIIGQNHLSVIEHVSITFYITGVSRNFTHELIRHRHLSYSEVSGRYVDPFEKQMGYVNPPNGDIELEETFKYAEGRYKGALAKFSVKNMLKGKRAREAARAYMPGSLETRIVVSGNLRSWVEFVSKRHHPAADAEMYRAAGTIYEHLAREFPAVFDPEFRKTWDSEFSQGESSHE